MQKPVFFQMTAALAVAVTLCGQAPAVSQSFQAGVQLYNKGKFQEALTAFKQSKEDGNVAYYSGLCYQQLRDFKSAKDCYQRVLQNYPDSPARGQAQAALSAFYKGGSSGSSTASASSSGSSSSDGGRRSSSRGSLDLSKCPQQSRVYYKNGDNAAGTSFMVNVYVNNRPIEMVFDTGASSIVFGKNHLAQLGIAPPAANRPADFHSSGVGSSSTIPCWAMKADVKVGDMLIPNCPITVMENLPTDPLLGQTFFKNFAYTIDYGAKSILLTRKDAVVASTVGVAVPFHREGNEMVVMAQVNGRPYEMYFDTGAMTCCFTAGDIKALNISVPDDAHVGQSIGVGGATRSVTFPISSLKLGPIEKRNMDISVVESANMGRPLLGQTFYEGWQYTIDNDKHCINFLRR